MARVLFFALLAMCLVCLIQAAPAGEQPQPAAAPSETPFLEKIAADAVKFGENVQTGVAQAINDFNNNPNVKKVLEGGQKLAEEIAGRIQTGIQSAIPKTE